LPCFAFIFNKSTAVPLQRYVKTFLSHLEGYYRYEFDF